MLEAALARFGCAPGHTRELALDFSDSSFDAVLICNLLHQLPEPELELREARRALKPSGVLVAPTFCHGQGWIAAATSRLLELTGFPIVTRFKGSELEQLITGEGFSIQEAQWFSGLLPVRLVVAISDKAQTVQ